MNHATWRLITNHATWRRITNHATWRRRSAAAAEEQKAFLLRENAEHERAINELLSKAGSVSAENAQLKQARPMNQFHGSLAS